MPKQGPFASATDPVAVADYIVEMSEQLASLAQRSGLDLLAYLLSMARLEAELVKKQLSPPIDATFE